MKKVEKQKAAIRKLAKEFRKVRPNLLKDNVGWVDLATGIKDIETTKRLCKEILSEGVNV